ncbi:MAG: tyrosine-type recombinase/integrase, partial [Nitrospinota bacterium]
MADYHSLDPNHDLLAAFRIYLHRKGDPVAEARLSTARRFLAGRNGSNGSVSAREVAGYLAALSPTFRADLKRFGAFLAERDRRRPEPAEGLERRLQELPPVAREPLLAYFHYLRRRNFALNTLRSYVGVLRAFALELPGVAEGGWASVSREDISCFIEAEQASGRRASTINVKLKVLHGFYEFLIEQGLAVANPLKRGAYLKMPEALPRPMAAEDTRRFLAVLKDVRDRAIFLVLLRTGMWVGELLAARVQDVELGEASFTIPKGKKNRRGRVVYLSGEVLEALVAYLPKRLPLGPGPIFLNEKGPWKGQGI